MSKNFMFPFTITSAWRRESVTIWLLWRLHWSFPRACRSRAMTPTAIWSHLPSSTRLPYRSANTVTRTRRSLPASWEEPTLVSHNRKPQRWQASKPYFRWKSTTASGAVLCSWSDRSKVNFAIWVLTVETTTSISKTRRNAPFWFLFSKSLYSTWYEFNQWFSFLL